MERYWLNSGVKFSTMEHNSFMLVLASHLTNEADGEDKTDAKLS